MTEEALNRIAIFRKNEIRKVIYKNEWWFSVVDVVQALTNQPDFQVARKYWNKLAERFRHEGSEVETNCHRLKLPAPDGKMRDTVCALKVSSCVGRHLVEIPNFGKIL